MYSPHWGLSKFVTSSFIFEKRKIKCTTDFHSKRKSNEMAQLNHFSQTNLYIIISLLAVCLMLWSLFFFFFLHMKLQQILIMCTLKCFMYQFENVASEKQNTCQIVGLSIQCCKLVAERFKVSKMNYGRYARSELAFVSLHFMSSHLLFNFKNDL